MQCRGETVDLVYNRVVGFSLGAKGHEELREAYPADAVDLTPQPRNHALFADKRNLILLSDPAAAEILGPRAAAKPAGGHGGKAVYRGDKITRRVWAEVQQGRRLTFVPRSGGIVPWATAPARSESARSPTPIVASETAVH